MADLEQKIKEIEEEIDKTPKNKGTEHHIGKLKAKMARLKETQQKKSSGGKGGLGYSLKKSGDATVVLVGFPSVGKSTLLNRITNANSRVGEYEFTTLEVIPGIMEYKGAKLQVLDVPGIIGGASVGKGRGKEILAVARAADLIVIMADVGRQKHINMIKNELELSGLRLDKKPPKVSIKKMVRGGINIDSTVKLTKISGQTIKSILNEYSIHNADILIHEDLDDDRFIDALMKNRIYLPFMVVVNKADIGEIDERENVIFISAKEGTNVDVLKERIFEKLEFMNVYTKPHGMEINYNEPLILKKSSTIEDMCRKIHKDFVRKFRFARIWGGRAKFEGQKVGMDFVLHEGDVVQLNLKK